MAVKKITGDAVLDAIISQIHKTFNKDLLTLGPSKEPIKAIPTGALGLDIATGINGIPVGRITEVYGCESSGKTSLTLSVAAQYEKVKATLEQNDRFILLIDLEHTITLAFLQSMGVDTERIIYCKPDSAEEAFQTMIDLAKSNKIGLIIIDSVDAAQTEAQLKKKVGELTMGGIGKIMSDTLREFSKVCERTQTTAIFINQIRQGLNPYGPQKVTPGGNALKFYSSLRLELLKPQPSKDMPNTMIMRVKIVKNKVGYPRANEIQFGFVYTKGPDVGIDLVETAKGLDILRFGGASCILELSDGTEQTVSRDGKTGLAELIRSDEAIRNLIRTRCIEAANSKFLPFGEEEVVYAEQE